MIYPFMVDVVPIDDPVRFVACTTKDINKGLGKMKEVNFFWSQQFKIEVTNTANIFMCGITISLWSVPRKCYILEHTYSLWRRSK